MRQDDCYGVATRLGCGLCGFGAYDQEKGGQFVTFHLPLGGDCHDNVTVQVFVTYEQTSVEQFESQVRRALEVETRRQIGLRQKALEKLEK